MRANRSTIYTTILGVMQFLNTSPQAQQTNGVPGSPSATTTIEGYQRPAPPWGTWSTLSASAGKAQMRWTPGQAHAGVRFKFDGLGMGTLALYVLRAGVGTEGKCPRSG